MLSRGLISARYLLILTLAVFLPMALPLQAHAFSRYIAQPKQVASAVDNPALAKPKKVRTVWPWAPFSDRQGAYPIIGHRTFGGKEWLRLNLPGRPNGLTGWVLAERVKQVPSYWSIRVDISNRSLAIWQRGKLVKRILVVVGAPSTPTPRGHFFIEDKVRIEQSWARGGWGLATSAYSDVLRHFEGGQGQIAIHTRGSLSAPMGTAASHGCIRVPASFAWWLARVVPPGTPLDIVR